MQANNSELRCAHCKRKLGVASGHYSITIKCHRCKGMTNWQAREPQQQSAR
ncbi:Com family DNA-binding transcriptional regulator [Denitrificimonas caeni]|uniref:Com family DNA-binding transcriptional regulator n=1 Tax=Denitrificimonas caeni TaxID=521720 RepID=UPI0019659982